MNNHLSFQGAALAALLAAALPVQAANWLMLQGTEPAGEAARAKVFGFLQAQYQKDFSDPCRFAPCTGQYIPPKLIGPDLESQDAFNVNRARIGVRGAGFPLDTKINYLLLAELGNNGITAPGDNFAKLTDASITFNHLRGARIRAGLFKTPGFEEGLQALPAFNYINLTTVGNQLMLERYADGDGAQNQNLFPPAQGGVLGANQNGFTQSVGAFRDVGVQLFDTFKVNDWEHSYALMVGNGNGLDFSDNDSNKELYAYWSSELVFGGKGPHREGLKLFAWTHTGERQLDRTNDGVVNPVEYDRDRYGVGVKYLKKPFRVSAEYLKGEGMIFVGPDKPSFDQNGTAAAGGDGADGKASGWYIDGGWYIPNSNWALNLRFDRYNRLEDDTGNPRGSLESQWDTWTIGAQYHFNKKTWIDINYAFRDVETPDFPAAAAGGNPNNNMEGIDDLFSIQVTAVF